MLNESRGSVMALLRAAEAELEAIKEKQREDEELLEKLKKLLAEYHDSVEELSYAHAE
jgi:hypothetical protein